MGGRISCRGLRGLRLPTVSGRQSMPSRPAKACREDRRIRSPGRGRAVTGNKLDAIRLGPV